jgi:hypothetical protein
MSTRFRCLPCRLAAAASSPEARIHATREQGTKNFRRGLPPQRILKGTPSGVFAKTRKRGYGDQTPHSSMAEFLEAAVMLAGVAAAIRAAQPAGEARDKARKTIERLEKKYNDLEKKNTKGAAEIRKKIQEAKQAFDNAQWDICITIFKNMPSRTV